MLYISNGKVYLRVSNKYKEVSITKKGENDYVVKANKKAYELSDLKPLTEISLKKAHELINKSKSEVK